MQTQPIGFIDLNISGIDKELANIYNLDLKNVYKEFICGSWLTLAMWNESGKMDDLIIRSYPGSAKSTKIVEKFPILISILDRWVNLNLVKYVRLALLGPNSVILPHRDYLETKEEFLRLHIPLITDQFCFYAENQNVYRLAKGEIWYIDARNPHSVACFSEHGRLHLILDFPLENDISKFINKDILFDSLHVPQTIKRDPLLEEQDKAIIELSKLIALNNFMDIASILTKLIYKVDIPVTNVFLWLKKIVEKSGNHELIMKITQLEKHCINSR